MATSAMDQSGIMALPEADQAPSGNKTAILTSDSFEGYKTALGNVTPEGGQAMDAATDQIMDQVDQMSDEQLDGLITLLQAMNDNPEQYKQILQMMIDGGNVDEGDFPPEYDSDFIATLSGLLLNAQNIRNKSKGAPMGQGIGGLPTSMPEGPQGFARGGIAEAVRMVASQGRRGDTMLAHINPTEARILKSMGGSGTINPATGLHEYGFFSGIVNAVTGAVKAVGNAISGVVKGVVSAVKQVLASPVGKILATVALAAFLGPAGAAVGGGFFGTATAMAAASGGITLLSGGSLKEAIINGGMAYFAAPGGPVSNAVSGAMGTEFAASMTGKALAAGVSGIAVGTGGGLLQGKNLKDSVKQGLTMGAIAGGVSLAGSAFGKTGPTTPEDALKAAQSPTDANNLNFEQAKTGAESFPVRSSNVQGTDLGPLDGGEAASRVAAPINEVAQSSPVRSGNVQSTELGPLESKVTSGVDANGRPQMNNPNFLDVEGQKANTVWQNIKETGRQLGEGEFGKAFDAAADIFVPAGDAGFMRTYAPAIAGGLAVTGMMGGYEQKPPPETELQKEMNAKTLEEYRDVRENPDKYAVQNQEGVTYGDKGQVINTGGAYDYKRVTPEDTQVGTRQVLGQGPSAYAPPEGVLTSSKGPIAQPYNMYDMYTNLMPQYYTQQAPRRAAMGGIAELATGGYPRRTGQISGPGTPTSDSIPAMLSDGEFVFTEKAVRGLGGGDRREGAKKMYALMHHLERNAARG